MPTHIYHPRRNPPTLWDRALVHPMDIPIALLALVAGTLLTVSGFNRNIDTGPFQDVSGTTAVVLTGLSMALGGVAAIVGLHWGGDKVSRGWQVERTGWILVGGGTLSYTIAVLATNPNNVLAWLATLFIFIGSLLTAISRWRIEQATRERGDQLKDEGMEL